MLCILSLSVAALAGCGSSDAPASGSAAADQASAAEETADPVDVNVMALKGPTAMGMVKFMNDAESGELTDNSYNFSITAATDEVSAALIQGKTDIAAVPANLASVLYNNTDGGVQVLAINTLGVLYIVENGDSVQSAQDLRGKTIYASAREPHRNTPSTIFSNKTASIQRAMSPLNGRASRLNAFLLFKMMRMPSRCSHSHL